MDSIEGDAPHHDSSADASQSTSSGLQAQQQQSGRSSPTVGSSDHAATEDDDTPRTSIASFGPTVAGDINVAAALRAQYAIDTPKPSRRRHKKMTSQVIDDSGLEQPIVDQTVSLPLHSKKTERQQRKQQRRTQKLLYQQSITPSLVNLPSELLSEVLSHLLPKDILSVRLVSHHFDTFVSAHNSTIARRIIHQRFWVLFRCFPVPVPLASVPASAHAALLHPKRQEMLNIHRTSYYQHVAMFDPLEMCTCMTCVFAWNNLCLVVDLYHWQFCLDNREPIPIIRRGTYPEWNDELLSKNARMVRKAMDDPMVYAHILALHLDTIIRTTQRNARWRWSVPAARIGEPWASPSGQATVTDVVTPATATKKPTPLYNLTDADITRGTDEFLERKGPPSYDFPFQRDNYYSLEAYCPNRKWSADLSRWFYYGLPPTQHERDLEWVRSWAVRAGPADLSNDVDVSMMRIARPASEARRIVTATETRREAAEGIATVRATTTTTEDKTNGSTTTAHN